MNLHLPKPPAPLTGSRPTGLLLLTLNPSLHFTLIQSQLSKLLVSWRAARESPTHQDCFLTEDKQEQADSGSAPLTQQGQGCGAVAPRQRQLLHVSAGRRLVLEHTQCSDDRLDLAAQRPSCVIKTAASQPPGNDIWCSIASCCEGTDLSDKAQVPMRPHSHIT